MTFFDCTADLVGQVHGNGQKGMLQIDAPPCRKFLATPLAIGVNATGVAGVATPNTIFDLQGSSCVVDPPIF